MVGWIITTDHNVPSLGRMLHVCSLGMACIIKFNVFHFGLLVSFHITNLRLKISGNEVTPGENHKHLHPVKFPMYTCMHVYLELPSFLPPYTCTFTNSHQRRLRWFSCSPLFYNTLRVLNYSNIHWLYAPWYNVRSHTRLVRITMTFYCYLEEEHSWSYIMGYH